MTKTKWVCPEDGLGFKDFICKDQLSTILFLFFVALCFLYYGELEIHTCITGCDGNNGKLKSFDKIHYCTNESI